MNEGISLAQFRSLSGPLSRSCKVTEIWSHIFPLLSFEYFTVPKGGRGGEGKGRGFFSMKKDCREGEFL